MTEFSEYIRRAREQRRWSLREAARHIKVPHSRLFELETGTSSKTGKPVSPTMDNLSHLATGYDLPIDHVFALAYFPAYLKTNRDLSSAELGMLDLFRQLTPARRELWLRVGEGLRTLPLDESNPREGP